MPEAPSIPEVKLSAPHEESVAVITFGSVAPMVTRLSIEARYAYLALCACALDKCRFNLMPDGGGGGGGGGGEVMNKDGGEDDEDYATLQFHRDVMRDLVSVDEFREGCYLLHF